MTAFSHGQHTAFRAFVRAALHGQEHHVHEVAVPGVAHVFGGDVDILAGLGGLAFGRDEGRAGTLYGKAASARLHGGSHDPAAALQAHELAAVGEGVQGVDDLALQLAGKAADAQDIVKAQGAACAFDGLEQELLVEEFTFFHRFGGSGRR